MELLTVNIAKAYRDRAKALPYNGTQDIGKRRELRQELQKRCGVTELEAINIINGIHIQDYCRKYLIKAIKAAEEEAQEQPKKRTRKSIKEYH